MSFTEAIKQLKSRVRLAWEKIEPKVYLYIPCAVEVYEIDSDTFLVSDGDERFIVDAEELARRFEPVEGLDGLETFDREPPTSMTCSSTSTTMTLPNWYGITYYAQQPEGYRTIRHCHLCGAWHRPVDTCIPIR